MSARRMVVAIVLAVGLAAAAGAASPASVSIVGVTPTIDRMPGPSFVQPDMRVTVGVRFQNLTNAPVAIRLERAYTSYDASKEGLPLKEVSIVDPKICGADRCSQFTLPPGFALEKIDIFAQGMAPEGDGSKIFVTLVMTVGQDTVTVRGFGDVTSAY